MNRYKSSTLGTTHGQWPRCQHHCSHTIPKRMSMTMVEVLTVVVMPRSRGGHGRSGSQVLIPLHGGGQVGLAMSRGSGGSCSSAHVLVALLHCCVVVWHGGRSRVMVAVSHGMAVVATSWSHGGSSSSGGGRVMVALSRGMW